ncbi:type 1 glutamine amidotransferase domain-containing protein [Pseudochelatococcus sp. B33]
MDNRSVDRDGIITLAATGRRMVVKAVAAIAATAMLTFGVTAAQAQVASSQKNVLIVLSAASEWTRADGSKYESGVWAEEFIVLDEKLVAAGYNVELATPGGVAPTMDPKSLDPAVAGEAHVRHFNAYLRANAARIANPLTLAGIDTARYAAVLIPGGHGPVEDLYKDADMGRILVEANRAGIIIAPVCHGQAALLAATNADGSWTFAGRRMTSFSDEEEVEFGTADNAPWLLAATLRERGAVYSQGPNWGAYVVTDGNLMSGQNPTSTAPLADAVIEALRRARAS